MNANASLSDNKKCERFCSLLLSDGAANIFDIYYSTQKKTTKNASIFLLAFFLVEPQIRLELMTCRLQGGCSTN